jgi:hypothetical protein
METDANYFNTESGLPIEIENFSHYRFIYFDPAVFDDVIFKKRWLNP